VVHATQEEKEELCYTMYMYDMATSAPGYTVNDGQYVCQAVTSDKLCQVMC